MHCVGRTQSKYGLKVVISCDGISISGIITALQYAVQSRQWLYAMVR